MYLFFAANPKKPATFDARKRLMDAAAGYGFLCVELEERAPEPGEDGVVIAIGGDGSIIRQVPVAMTAHMPILGVHFGRVGFLTELTEEGFIAALPRLKAGDYRLEQRNMLDCQVSTGLSVPERRGALQALLLRRHGHRRQDRWQERLDGIGGRRHGIDAHRVHGLQPFGGGTHRAGGAGRHGHHAHLSP